MESHQEVAIVALLLVAIASNLEVSYGQTICNMSGQQLLDCKPAVTPPNPPPPSDTCCQALKYADMKCLCSYKNSGVLSSLGIDPNRAMQLPKKCRLPNPVRC